MSNSAKAKGRKGQNDIRDVLRTWFPSLDKEDIESRPMGSNGTDIILTPAAKKKFPYSIEIKNSERINIYNAIEQVKKNQQPNTNWVVIFKKNRTPFSVTISLEHFTELLKKANIIENT